MTTIKYVCSIGPRCHSASILKRLQLKKVSFPFDWIFSNLDMVLHCIENDFKIFLNPKYFSIREPSSTKQQHSYYKENDDDAIFNHHNPLYKKDYNYFVRCTERFKTLLNQKELKLFVITYLNFWKIDEPFKATIIEKVKKLNNYTTNYGILCIIQYVAENKEQEHTFTFSVYNNIHFLEVYTKSASNGAIFLDETDNVFLDNLLFSTYTFDIMDIPYVSEDVIIDSTKLVKKIRMIPKYPQIKRINKKRNKHISVKEELKQEPKQETNPNLKQEQEPTQKQEQQQDQEQEPNLKQQQESHPSPIK